MTDAPDPLLIALTENWQCKAVAEKHVQTDVQALCAAYEARGKEISDLKAELAALKPADPP